MNKLLIKLVIIEILILLITGICISNSYAITNELEKKYTVMQSEEEKFLFNIYSTETDNLKIKNIDKKISEENYIVKEMIEAKTLTKSDEEYIKSKFGELKEFDDGEYKGILKLDSYDIDTINNGFYEKIDEKILTFTNYTDNDLKSIEKETKIDGQTYYLINVEWEIEKSQLIDNQNVPITYKGRKIYQTVQTIQNPNTYRVTVTYKGNVDKIDTIYEYTINYEMQEKQKIKREETSEEKKNNIPIFIVSGIGLTVLLAYLLNNKNTYLYIKTKNGFKLIKKVRLSNKNLSIDITDYKNREKDEIYAIKIKPITFKKMQKRTITIIKGTQRKDITLWNNYYEIRL